MENEFKEVMSQRTDEELIEIVTIEKENYNPVAVQAAEIEIKKRKLDVSKFEDIKEKAIVKKKQEDNVDSKVVGLGIRFLNFLIDILIWLVLSFIMSFIVGLFMFPTNQYFYSILIFGTFIGYFAIIEIKFQKTVGKFITKTKVVKLNGEKP